MSPVLSLLQTKEENHTNLRTSREPASQAFASPIASCCASSRVSFASRLLIVCFLLASGFAFASRFRLSDARLLRCASCLLCICCLFASPLLLVCFLLVCFLLSSRQASKNNSKHNSSKQVPIDLRQTCAKLAPKYRWILLRSGSVVETSKLTIRHPSWLASRGSVRNTWGRPAREKQTTKKREGNRHAKTGHPTRDWQLPALRAASLVWRGVKTALCSTACLPEWLGGWLPDPVNASRGLDSRGVPVPSRLLPTNQHASCRAVRPTFQMLFVFRWFRFAFWTSKQAFSLVHSLLASFAFASCLRQTG